MLTIAILHIHVSHIWGQQFILHRSKAYVWYLFSCKREAVDDWNNRRTWVRWHPQSFSWFLSTGISWTEKSTRLSFICYDLSELQRAWHSMFCTLSSSSKLIPNACHALTKLQHSGFVTLLGHCFVKGLCCLTSYVAHRLVTVPGIPIFRPHQLVIVVKQRESVYHWQSRTWKVLGRIKFTP